jgi:hypothetical protein
MESENVAVNFLAAPAFKPWIPQIQKNTLTTNVRGRYQFSNNASQNAKMFSSTRALSLDEFVYF